MSTGTVETKAAAIPRRMHLPYARRVARMGYDIRRAEWTSKWWRFRGGVWLVVEDGVERILEGGDATKSDFLAWDWTVLPADCAAPTESDAKVDQAELLKVRPYDGLADSAVPVDIGCESPVLSITGGWVVGPSVVALPGVPAVSDDPVLVDGEDFDPLVIPLGPKDAAPVWKRTRRPNYQPGGDAGSEEITAIFRVTNGIPGVMNGATCYPNYAPGNMFCPITSGTVKISSGNDADLFRVKVKIAGYGLSGGFQWLPLNGTATEITIPANVMRTWGNGAQSGIQLPTGHDYTLTAEWSLVGGTETGVSDPVVIEVPGVCP